MTVTTDATLPKVTMTTGIDAPTFTVLSNDGADGVVSDSFAMLKSAVHVE